MTSSDPRRWPHPALLALVAAVSLAWSRDLMAEFTLAKFVALNLCLAAAAWSAAARPGSWAGGATALDRPLAACLLAAIFAAAAADDPRLCFRGRYDSYASGVWGTLLVALTALAAARAARGREGAAVRFLLAVGALVAGYAALQRLGFDPIFQVKALPTRGRAVSSLGSPVDLGAYLALLFPLYLARLDETRGAGSAFQAALAAAGLLAAGSRGAMAAAAVGAASYWILTRRRSPRALPACIALAACAAIFLMAWSARPGASVSDATRVEVWKVALEAFRRRPWLGWGLDGFEDAFKLLRSRAFVEISGTTGHYQAYAHNEFLHVLAGAGLAGAAAYAWLLTALARAARAALDAAKSRPLAAGLIAGLLALGVNRALNPVALEVAVTAAVACGLLASLAASAAPAFRGGPAAWAAAALLSALVLHAAGMALADFIYKRGLRADAAGDSARARLDIAAARAAAPCELSYITGEINAAMDWINATRSLPERLEFLARVDAGARAALRCHPSRSTAHYAAAVAARIHSDLGFRERLDLAARELDAAIALDPLFEPLHLARARVEEQRRAK